MISAKYRINHHCIKAAIAGPIDSVCPKEPNWPTVGKAEKYEKYTVSTTSRKDSKNESTIAILFLCRRTKRIGENMTAEPKIINNI